jgi:glutathione S-transferase
MNQELKGKLEKILADHKLWLENNDGGTRAYLTGADLTGADLTGANLTRANLNGADLTGADLDFSCWPLWCGSLNARVDQRIINQLAYHLAALPDCPKALKKALAKYANKFHRVTNGECKKIVIGRGKWDMPVGIF